MNDHRVGVRQAFGARTGVNHTDTAMPFIGAHQPIQRLCNRHASASRGDGDVPRRGFSTAFRCQCHSTPVQCRSLRQVLRLLLAGTSQSGVQVGGGEPVIQGGPAGKILSGSPRAGFGRVEPIGVSDFSPETCHSWALRGKNFERLGKDSLWPGRDSRRFVQQRSLATTLTVSQ